MIIVICILILGIIVQGQEHQITLQSHTIDIDIEIKFSSSPYNTDQILVEKTTKKAIIIKNMYNDFLMIDKKVCLPEVIFNNVLNNTGYYTISYTFDYLEYNYLFPTKDKIEILFDIDYLMNIYSRYNTYLSYEPNSKIMDEDQQTSTIKSAFIFDSSIGIIKGIYSSTVQCLNNNNPMFDSLSFDTYDIPTNG